MFKKVTMILVVSCCSWLAHGEDMMDGVLIGGVTGGAAGVFIGGTHAAIEGALPERALGNFVGANGGYLDRAGIDAIARSAAAQSPNIAIMDYEYATPKAMKAQLISELREQITDLEVGRGFHGDRHGNRGREIYKLEQQIDALDALPDRAVQMVPYRQEIRFNSAAELHANLRGQRGIKIKSVKIVRASNHDPETKMKLRVVQHAAGWSAVGAVVLGATMGVAAEPQQQEESLPTFDVNGTQSAE